MTAASLDDAVVVVHPVLAPISDDDIAAALSPATFGPGTTTLRLSALTLELGELPQLDWPRAHEALTRELDEKLVPAMHSHAGAIHYLGMVPIPLAIEIGRRIGPPRRLVAYQQRHDTKSWRWPSEEESVRVELHDVPQTVCRAKGDVIVRVSCSHRISADDAREVVPNAIGELHVDVEDAGEDVLQSDADATRVAAKFGEALDRVNEFFPYCDAIHLFAAVPPALAIRLGAEINPTIHIPIQTYQFSGRDRPRYVRALLIGESAPPELTDEQRTVADSTRCVFANALHQVSAFVDGMPSDAHWLDELVGPTASSLEGPVRRVGSLMGARSLVGARIDHEVRDANGEFRFDPDARAWVFDDRLLAALADRLAGDDLERAARLFLLHESVHIERQGLTSATADGIGALPRVLEEVDYIADVSALLHEYARTVRAGGGIESDAPAAFKHLLRVVTATFWAFDAGNAPLRAVQVRRLNRYLIWYWQHRRMQGAADLGDALRILSEKPVLEISGPRVFTWGGRIMFDLDPVAFRSVEFGAVVDGYRPVRVGSRRGAPVSAVLEALRNRDEPGFRAALEAIHETVRNAG